jgi:hypothetical protein
VKQPNAVRPKSPLEEAFGQHEPCYPLQQVDLSSAIVTGMTGGKAVQEVISQKNASSLMDSSFEDEVALIDRRLPGSERVIQAVRAHWAKIPGEPQTGFWFCQKRSNKAVGSPGVTGRNSKTDLYTSRIRGSANKVASNHIVKAWNFFLVGAISIPVDQTTRQRDKMQDQHRNQQEKEYLLQESHLSPSHSAQSLQIPGKTKSTHHTHLL